MPEHDQVRVSVAVVRMILRYLEAHGGVPEDFFSGLPVLASHYEGGEAWLSYEDFKSLFHRIQWVTGEEDIAYKIAAWTVRYRSLGIFGFLSRISR
ncbi:MAG: hypothetical protein KC466_00480, partial [Myxococcales bacterium]|nr:hypothetical protein [Myxococcales bacterium]